MCHDTESRISAGYKSGNYRVSSYPESGYIIDYYTLSDYVGGIKKNTFCLTRIAKMNSKGGEIWRQLNAY